MYSLYVMITLIDDHAAALWTSFDAARIVCGEGPCNGRTSVCPSDGLSHRSTAATAAGGFAAERRAGRRYQSTAAGALRAPCCRRRRSAANAGSVSLRADEGGST